MWNSAEPVPPAFSEAEIRSVFLGLMLAMLLAALDQTIVSVALPTLAADLRGLDLMAWVVSAYLISAAVATPIFGKLGDLYGRRPVLTAAIAIFLIGATGCASTQTMPLLVVARIVQGIGGGALIAVSQAAIADVVAPRERGRYQVYFSTVHVVASVSGPVIGGLLTQYLSWRWIFWINLPLGALALLVSRSALARLPAPRGSAQVDYAGALLLSAGLVALLLGITRIGMGVPILAPVQIGIYGSAALLLAAFAWHERRAVDPLIPLALLAIPTVRISCLILFVGFMQLVALTVLIPLQRQLVLGLSTGAAALYLIPLTLAGPCGAYCAGRVMLRTGRTRALQVGGAAMVAAGLLVMGLAGPAAIRFEPVLLIWIGIGIGLQFPTSLVAIQNAVPARHIGVATAAAAFSRALGAAIGVAVLTAILLALLGGEGSSGAQVMRELVAAASAGSGAAAIAALASARSAFRAVFLIASGIAAVSFLVSLLLTDTPLRGKPS